MKTPEEMIQRNPELEELFDLIGFDEVEEAIAPDEVSGNLHDQEFMDWYTRKLATLQAEIDILNTQHQRRLKTAQGRIRALEYMNAERAQRIAIAMIEKQGKKKSIDLPYGRFSITDSKPYATIKEALTTEEIEKIMEDDFLPNDFFEVKPKIKLNEVKKAIKYAGGDTFVWEDGQQVDPKIVKRLNLEGVPAKRTISFKAKGEDKE